MMQTDSSLPIRKRQITEGEKAQIKELLPHTPVKDEMRIAQARLNFIGKLGKSGDAHKISQR